MQTTKLWLNNYLFPVAVTVFLIMQGLNSTLIVSTLIVQVVGVLLLLAVMFKLGILLKNEWQHHLYQKQQLELANDYWRQKSSLPIHHSSQQHWNGLRNFTVIKKVCETEDICSFYLKPHDGKPLPEFHAGQYLTLQIKHPEQNKLLTRCYSLSDSHCADYYRISVKKEPEGLMSNYLHQQLKEGDILEAKAPTGDFYLKLEPPHPVVLIAGGVGITPLLSMLNTLIEREDEREVHLFYGVRNGSEVMMKEYLETLSEKRPQFHLHLCYSRPNADEVDYLHHGRIDIALLRSTLSVSNYHYYLCGSLAMMEGLSEGLKAWNVPENDIYFESFGTTGTTAKVIEETGETYPVLFRKSKKSLQWSAKEGTLLEFAEKNSIPIESACRSGQCGMCQTKISEGDVEYLTEPSAEIEKGSCLSCISIPKGALVVDL